MSAQQLELAVLYAYNPPGVGEEAAEVKAQVCEVLHLSAAVCQKGVWVPIQST